MRHLFAHARRQTLLYIVLALAIGLGVGGGYALAASTTKTITVCADKGTGVLHLKTHGRCKRSQTRVTWNQRGPQGPQGGQGPAGQPGAPAVSIWANVTNAGAVLRRTGHLGPASSLPARTRSRSPLRHAPMDPTRLWSASRTQIPRADRASGTFPVAWYESTAANQQFKVFTGVVVRRHVHSRLTIRSTVMDSCM